jgi:hypothetical protein
LSHLHIHTLSLSGALGALNELEFNKQGMRNNIDEGF